MRQVARTLSLLGFALCAALSPLHAGAAPAQAAAGHVAWSRNANICEVNIRQYRQEGTFKAYTLPGNAAKRSLQAWDYSIEVPKK